MSIIKRAKRDSGYAVLPNAVTQNKELSWEARGMLCYLLSLPDDWEISVVHLIGQSPAGETKTRRIIKELEESGYLVRERKQNVAGTFYYESTVYDQPHGGNRDAVTETRKQPCLISKEEQVPSNKKDAAEEPADDLASVMARSKARLDAELSGSGTDDSSVRRTAEYTFETATGLLPPKSRSSAAALWWKPLRELCDMGGWDKHVTSKLIMDSVVRLKGATVKSPKSILSTAKSIMSERHRLTEQSVPFTTGGVGVKREMTAADRRFLG